MAHCEGREQSSRSDAILLERFEEVADLELDVGRALDQLVLDSTTP